MPWMIAPWPSPSTAGPPAPMDFGISYGPTRAPTVSGMSGAIVARAGATLDLQTMAPLDTKRLPARPDVVAPDGSDVRILLQTSRGSMAHFELAPGRTSKAVRHRTVEEIWFVLAGRGEMW